MNKKILVAYDGSLMSRHAIQEAKRQAAHVSETEVHVITVIKPTGPKANAAVARSIENELADHFQPQMEKIMKEFEAEAIPIFTQVIFDDTNENAGAKLCEYAEDNKVDLIVVGSRGLVNIKGLFVGSVSKKILNHATCPVFVIK
ncbi:universal stress protein [Virgibacillus byunsanensis]|uniref:Universal stress protein n=1 Tax=Virgibacillus byunsanensis TaxID=570945 RepID=A0ABW3LT35_9BACI